MDYTRNLGKSRFENSAAKSLIYQTGDANLPKEKSHHGRTRPAGAVPFATFEDSEEDKYPTSFHMRHSRREGTDKIGLSKDFNPAIYSQQIANNRAMKELSARKAYQGAGHILSHSTSKSAAEGLSSGGHEAELEPHAHDYQPENHTPRDCPMTPLLASAVADA